MIILALEILYILSGIVSLITGIYSFRDDSLETRFGTGLFLGNTFYNIYIWKNFACKICWNISTFNGSVDCDKTGKIGSFKEVSEEFKIKKIKSNRE